MDKYDKLFADIEEKTIAGKLSWDIIPLRKYSEFMINASMVLRAFEADYPPDGDQSFKLVLVDRKILQLDSFDIEHETRNIELLVLSGDEITGYKLVFVLTDGHVDSDKLFRLLEYVEDQSDEAKYLFALVDP